MDCNPLVIPELAGQVFSYLSLACQQLCMRVCKQWFDILVAKHWRTCGLSQSRLIPIMSNHSRAAIYAAHLHSLHIDCNDLYALNNVDCPQLKELHLVNNGKHESSQFWVTSGRRYANLERITFRCSFLPLGLVYSVMERFGRNVNYTTIIAQSPLYPLRTAKIRQTFGFFHSSAIKALEAPEVVFASSDSPTINMRVLKTLAIFPGIRNITLKLSMTTSECIDRVIDRFTEYAPFHGIEQATLWVEWENVNFIRQLQGAKQLALYHAPVPMIRAAIALPKLVHLELDPSACEKLDHSTLPPQLHLQ